MVKRKGYVIERVADMDNLRAADQEAQKGKVAKYWYIRRHNANAEEELRELRRMILDLDFPNPRYKRDIVTSGTGRGRKTRDIDKQNYFPWKILHHAILRVIDGDMLKTMIYDTSASIKGRGIHFAAKRMKRFMRLHPELKWYVKTDFKKFYQSIPHELIIAMLRRKYKDERFIRLIEVAVLNYESGDDILQTLEDEEYKKRHQYWCANQPEAGQSVRKRD